MSIPSWDDKQRNARQCGTCAFYSEPENQCRQAPPMVVPGRGSSGLWPVVSRYDWCGFWRSKVSTYDERQAAAVRVACVNSSCRADGIRVYATASKPTCSECSGAMVEA